MNLCGIRKELELYPEKKIKVANTREAKIAKEKLKANALEQLNFVLSDY